MRVALQGYHIPEDGMLPIHCGGSELSSSAYLAKRAAGCVAQQFNSLQQPYQGVNATGNKGIAFRTCSQGLDPGSWQAKAVSAVAEATFNAYCERLQGGTAAMVSINIFRRPRITLLLLLLL